MGQKVNLVDLNQHFKIKDKDGMEYGEKKKKKGNSTL